MSCAKETYIISKRDPLHVRKRPIFDVKEAASHLKVKKTHVSCKRHVSKRPIWHVKDTYFECKRGGEFLLLCSFLPPKCKRDLLHAWKRSMSCVKETYFTRKRDLLHVWKRSMSNVRDSCHIWKRLLSCLKEIESLCQRDLWPTMWGTRNLLVKKPMSHVKETYVMCKWNLSHM